MNAPPASAQRPAAAQRLDAWEADMPTDRSHGGDGWIPGGPPSAVGSRSWRSPLVKRTPGRRRHSSRQRFCGNATGALLRAPAPQSAWRCAIPPTTLDERCAVAAVLANMDAEIAELGDKIAKVRAVKKGVMQMLLTGEIRLI